MTLRKVRRKADLFFVFKTLIYNKIKTNYEKSKII